MAAIVGSTSQAELAAKLPERRYASGPAFRSAMTCSMIAWRRWSASASSIGSGELVKTAWWRNYAQPFVMCAWPGVSSCP